MGSSRSASALRGSPAGSLRSRAPALEQLHVARARMGLRVREGVCAEARLQLVERAIAFASEQARHAFAQHAQVLRPVLEEGGEDEYGPRRRVGAGRLEEVSVL